MPCFNSERYLDEAIRSVVMQEFRDWELIICDDGSNDNSKQIAESWAQGDLRIKVLENRFEKGAAGARNSCLDIAQGRYIAFLDADDVWSPKKLEKQIQHMQKTGSCFSVTHYDVMDESGRIRHEVMTPKAITFSLMMYSNFIPCLTAVYDSLALGKVPQPNIKKRNDYALWLTLFRNIGCDKATSVPENLASYRQNNYGLSSSGRDALFFYFICLRKYAGRALLPSLYFSFIYLAIVLIKKQFPKIYNYIVIRF